MSQDMPSACPSASDGGTGACTCGKTAMGVADGGAISTGELAVAFVADFSVSTSVANDRDCPDLPWHHHHQQYNSGNSKKIKARTKRTTHVAAFFDRPAPPFHKQDIQGTNMKEKHTTICHIAGDVHFGPKGAFQPILQEHKFVDGRLLPINYVINAMRVMAHHGTKPCTYLGSFCILL